MPKQAFLSDEMQPKTIKEVEDAADNLHSIRTERIGLNKREDDAQALLVSVMKKHELEVYKFADGSMIVTLEQGKTKAKVKEVEESDSDKEEDQR
jgi:hypothetical protein